MCPDVGLTQEHDPIDHVLSSLPPVLNSMAGRTDVSVCCGGPSFSNFVPIEWRAHVLNCRSMIALELFDTNQSSLFSAIDYNAYIDDNMYQRDNTTEASKKARSQKGKKLKLL